jgi:peptide methionine sulfoxide reductase MsrB
MVELHEAIESANVNELRDTNHGMILTEVRRASYASEINH